MTLVLVRKLLRDLRWPLLAVSLLLCLFTLLWVKIAQRVTVEIYPFFNGVAALSKLNPKVFEEVLFKGPGRVSQAVMGGGEMHFENPADFLAAELLHPVVITVICLWAVGRAAGAIAGELDRGTMELLLSQPVPRSRLILAHFLVDCIVIPAIALVLFLGMRVGLWLVGPFEVDYTVLDTLKSKATFAMPEGPRFLAVSVEGQWGAVMNLAALMFAVSGLTLAISSVNRSRWRATGWATLMVLGMFVLNVVGQLWGAIEPLRPASLFFYYQPQKIWLKSLWTVGEGVPVMVVLAAVGVSGYAVALIAFRRRDLQAPL